ncbi:glycosyltransferase [Paenibacillus sp. N3.4]|uniref:CgeB family protein n=1 Tax=Paenibacillus sp. N3.4 TaxID=2603222 RepID=UPI0016508118|nr:glycosyltransferase [Paenibacillus sp. N3.4]
MKRLRIFFLNHLSCYINSLADALCQLGHSIYYQTSWEMREIEAGISYFKPDLLITVGIDKPMFHPSLDVIPDLCHKYGLLHIYWATEDKIHFDGISVPFVRRVKPDIVWTIHPECVKKYQNMEIGSAYLNFAFNPRMFSPKSENPAEIYDVSFIGTTHLETRTFRYDSLKQLLFPLIQAEVEVGVWGNNWLESKDFLEIEFGASIPPHRFHGYISYKNTSDIYHKTKIMLGVQNAVDQVSQRTFEILGTGAFMIASRTEELERLFEDKKEIVLTSSQEETLELVSYYLKRPEERMLIGRQAREKVLSNHTFSMHLQNILPAIDKPLGEKRRARRW